MNSVLHLLFRRLRIPLISLICIYAVSILGFVLIPGIDDHGKVWHMDFFHAFYFVSFMGTTIGFGEIPYAFTDAQRLWTVITLYATVFAWLYAIGALLSLLQDPGFRRATKHNSFLRRLRRLHEPYYLICGYGDTGSLLVEDLAWRGIRTVVVDIDQEAIDNLDIAGHLFEVPGLCADASDPDVLVTAGLTRANCLGVVALSHDDPVNLTIALSSKLLAPDTVIICRAEQQDTRDNMASFGTDHIINPYLSFADRLAMAIHSPSMNLLFDWMTSTYDMPLSEPVSPPKGKWIVCGYGRFGKAVQKYLNFEGMETVIVEARPEATGAPPNTVIGRGTEASTLRKAKIENAVGIVAGTDNGSNNLSIIMTAHDLKPDLFLVARQVHKRTNAIFTAAKADMIMHPGSIIARSVLALIVNPMLGDFLRLARAQDDDWANILISRLSGLVGDHAPNTWIIEVRACGENLLDTARAPVKCKICLGVLGAVADDCPQLIVPRLRDYGNVSRQILPQ